VLSVFTSSLFTGVPLAYLPFNLASAIPFIAVAVGMGIAINFLNRDISTTLEEKFATVILIAFGWWTYLWGSPTFNHYLYYPTLMANGLTFWQTLNGQYIIQLEILLILFSISLRTLQSSVFLVIGSGAIFGLIAGTAGTTLSLSILLGGVTFIALRQFLNSKPSSKEIYFWSSLCIGLLTSLIACHFLLQGNVIRVKTLNIHVDTSWTSLLFMVRTTVLEGLLKWVKSYFNHGALFFLLLTCGYYWLRGFSSNSPKTKNILALAFLFSAFALLQCFINRLSEFFSYEGYWHFASPMVCSFISLYFFGIWGASKLNAMNLKSYFSVTMVCIYMVALFFSVSANIFMFEKIYHRYERWMSGAAPEEGVSDIEDAKGWQNQCWQKLLTLKGAQDPRGH
jgi:hypothetical protein